MIDTIPLLKNLTGIGFVTYIYAKELRKSSHEFIYYYAWFSSSELKERPLAAYDKAVTWVKRFIPRPYFITHAIKTVIFNIILLLKKPDVFFQPNYISFRMLTSTPVVTMVHDLSHIHFSQFHPKDRVEHFTSELVRSLKNSAKVIAISEYTKQDLIKLELAKEEDIEVIHNGVSKNFKPLCEHLHASTVLEELKLSEKGYFLFVGTMEPRKNLDLLLKAYLKYVQTTSSPTPLVLAGGVGWRSEFFDALLQEALKLPSVRKLGYVSNETLPILFAAAKVFIFPSHYEGFGLPPLEAMASGTAVIASNSSSIPEVIEDAGILINPINQQELLDAMILLDDNKDRRQSFEKLGILQARKFSWEIAAKRLEQVFIDVTTT